MERHKVFTGSKWEKTAGYCRAQRMGNRILVAGTTAVQNGKIVGEGDAYQQALYIFGVIEKALVELGGSMEDVVLTRMYLTDIAQWEAVSKAHGEYFRAVCPVSTLLEVKGLIQPGLLVEIEVEAMVAFDGGAAPKG